MFSSLRVSVCAFVVAAALGAPGATRAASTGQSAPSYPGSKLALSVKKTQRAGSVVTVVFSGRNALFDPTNPMLSTSYTVNLFAQVRSVLPTCPRSYDTELNNVINLGSRTVFEIGNGYNVGREGPFRYQTKYRSGRARQLVYCGYTRLITDDAAYAQLRVTLAKPRRG